LGNSQYTNALLDYLSSAGIKTTFFVIGVNVLASQAAVDAVKRAYNAGHQIGYVFMALLWH
jgi:peptidoglycan/xylan/chitin deacetylase (PgdA/CDA1 family)